MQALNQEQPLNKSHQSLARVWLAPPSLTIFSHRNYHFLVKLMSHITLCQHLSKIWPRVPKMKLFSKQSPSKFQILWPQHFKYSRALPLHIRIHPALKGSSQETAFSSSMGRVRFSLTMCSRESFL